MTVLDYVDYADDIVLLSSRLQDAQQKAQRLSKIANATGLKVSTKKTQGQRKNTRVNDAVMIDGINLQDVEEFTYLGTNVATTGNCDQVINTRINKANQAFAMLRHVCSVTNLSVHTTIKIFRSNVLCVLLYGDECWKTTSNPTKTRGVPDQMPSTHSQDILAQRHLKR